MKSRYGGSIGWVSKGRRGEMGKLRFSRVRIFRHLLPIFSFLFSLF